MPLGDDEPSSHFHVWPADGSRVPAIPVHGSIGIGICLWTDSATTGQHSNGCYEGSGFGAKTRFGGFCR